MDNDVIACSLDAKSLQDRFEAIAALNARSLLSAGRDDLTLTLNYDAAAMDDVRKMVAGEQSCCAFLNFKIDEHPDFVRVSIVAPDSARDAAEALFGPFAGRGNDTVAKSCGCKSECGA